MKRDSEKLEAEAKKMFDNLREHLGERVTMLYSHYGSFAVIEGDLSEVHDFICVVVGGTGVPLVGYGNAVLEIKTMNDEILYENNHIAYRYDHRETEEIYEARRDSFGDRVVDEEIQKREEALKKYKEEMESGARTLQRSMLTLQKEGLPFVKPGLVKNWMNFVEYNCLNNGLLTVNAVVEAMKELADGIPYADVIGNVFDEAYDLTEEQEADVVNLLAFYIKQGEEFKTYWDSTINIVKK